MTSPDYIQHRINCTTQGDGSLLLSSELRLGAVANSTGDWLHQWAEATPDSVFLMERSGAGWRQITYRDTLEQVRAIASALIERGMDSSTPIVVLSGPSIDHAVLMLAALYIGVPVAPLAEQYSLVPEAGERLDHCIRKIKPSLVFAQDAEKFRSALDRESISSIPNVTSTNSPSGAVTFASLLKNRSNPSLDDAHRQVGPETLAKILFTSGSTGNPKGVPQSQRMMTVNQAQYVACCPWFAARPPVIVDWLPWNHVFAGNANFNLILSNGGTLILDDGKPVKGLFDRTLENLSMHTGTLSFNVPIAYALLIEAFRKDRQLKRRFFSDLDLIFYAGASLPDDVWLALETMAKEVSGQVPMMTSSWGLTETAPACLMHHQGGAESGMIGVPVPKLTAKLIPCQGERYEIRVKGPNVITAYFDEPEKDQQSFDEQGYFITNDAVRFVDPGNYTAGVRFDGRLSEDFKLLTGTWVRATQLRLQVLAVLEGLAQDVVITGADKREVGLLVFPSPDTTLDNDGVVVTDNDYRTKIVSLLRLQGKNSTGSSNRVARVLVMAQPPSIKDAEITAKGSLNINAILSARAHLLERLYDDNDAACIKI